MTDNNIHRLSSYALILFSAVVDFKMLFILFIASIFTLLFVMPAFDFSDELFKTMREDGITEETFWKTTNIMVMFITLVCVLHKPILMIFN